MQPTVASALELIQSSDPEKYRLLKEFHARLQDRKTLPESQDIRQFAQLVGLKEIHGKSRKDMIPTLMRFLLERATDRLRTEIPRADDISEQQRQEGFSILTDKLLSHR
jgi:RNA polymerase-interacting CarD/CdnL/TRCF family regulator